MSVTVEPEYLTVNEFAAQLKVSSQTVKKWIKKGQICFVKLPGRGDYRINKDYAKNWLDKRTIKARTSFS